MENEEKITAVLWKHGLTPNYLGFSYLVMALDMALEGEPISREMIQRIAQRTGRKSPSVYRSMQTALCRLTDMPNHRPYARGEYVYHQIYTLYQELQRQIQT
jgi:hypothetical protein